MLQREFRKLAVTYTNIEYIEYKFYDNLKYSEIDACRHYNILKCKQVNFARGQGSISQVNYYYPVRFASFSTVLSFVSHKNCYQLNPVTLPTSKYVLLAIMPQTQQEN